MAAKQDTKQQNNIVIYIALALANTHTDMENMSCQPRYSVSEPCGAGGATTTNCTNLAKQVFHLVVHPLDPALRTGLVVSGR